MSALCVPPQPCRVSAAAGQIQDVVLGVRPVHSQQALPWCCWSASGNSCHHCLSSARQRASGLVEVFFPVGFYDVQVVTVHGAGTAGAWPPPGG